MIFRCCKRRIKKPIAKAKPVLSDCLTQWGISHNAKHIKYHGHKNISSGKICHGTFAALVQLISTRNFSSLLGKMGVFPEVWAQCEWESDCVTFHFFKCLHKWNQRTFEMFYYLLNAYSTILLMFFLEAKKEHDSKKNSHEWPNMASIHTN